MLFIQMQLLSDVSDSFTINFIAIISCPRNGG